MNIIKEGPLVVVDKKATGKRGVQTSLKQALEECQPGSTIKISSNIYNEGLIIKQPNVTLEPKDMGGEVTLQ